MNNLQINTLCIQNFATFEDQTIFFNEGLNTIIGETGSGKSLIVDALQLILGARADKKLIRKGCDFLVVEASFKPKGKDILNYFNELGLPFQEEIVIKRIIYREESSKSYVNFQQTNMSTLTSISKRYIDLVGQFENQKLFSEKYQLTLLDNFSKDNVSVNKFKNDYSKYIEAKSQHSILNVKSSDTIKELDYIKFQISELEKLSPSKDEETALQKNKEMYLAHEVDQKIYNELNSIFEGNHTSSGLIDSLNHTQKLLSQLSGTESIVSNFISASDQIKEITYHLSKSQDFEFSESELDNTMTRLDQYKKLQLKHNTNTDGLVDIIQDLKAQLENLENMDLNISNAKKNLEQTHKNALISAKALHDIRVDNSTQLATDLTNSVQELRMQGASFQIKISESELTSMGISSISLMAQTNPGEGFYRVKDIASGGELSRILLALRQVLAANDSVSIFLFDEIDTGIGGETALLIGKALKNVSETSQVIAITHLPQIASFANKLILVSKEIKEDSKTQRTISIVKEVTGDDIRKEIDLMTPLYN